MQMRNYANVRLFDKMPGTLKTNSTRLLNLKSQYSQSVLSPQ